MVTTAVAPGGNLQAYYDAASPGDILNIPSGNYAGITGQAKGTQGNPITLNFAAGAVITGFSAKDTTHYAALNFEQGTGYVIVTGSVLVKVSGTQKAGIRMASTTRMSGCEVLGATVDGAFTGIFFGGIDNGMISRCVCKHSTDQHGIYLSSCTNTMASYNTCFNNPWNGIHTNVRDCTDIINTGNFITGNIVYGNGQAGFDMTGASNFRFSNNLSFDNSSHGVVWQNTNQCDTPACIGNIIVNNTLIGGAYGIAFGGVANAGNSAGNIIYNNISIGTSGGIGLSSASGPLDPTCKLSNNLMAGQSLLFVSAADYHLKAGSPAIGAGVSSFAGDIAPTADLENTTRVTFDCGCYAYAGTTPPVNIPLTAAVAMAAGDVNMDGIVNIQDMTVVANHFGWKYDPTKGLYVRP